MEENLFLEGVQDPITEGLDSLINDFTFIPFTISLRDPRDQEVFSLHKKRSTPFSTTNFVIIYSKGRVEVSEGKTFQMPNLSFKTKDRQLELVGRVMDQVFYLMEGDEALAVFQGRRQDKEKEYSIDIKDPSLDREIYLASALILDNLYHDY